MMPFTPMNDNFERVIENIQLGTPEEGSPAAQGGIGADTPEIGQAGQNLQQEGVLGEAVAEQTKSGE